MAERVSTAALMDAVHAALASLDQLDQHASELALGEQVKVEVLRRNLRARLERSAPVVAVAGEKKAGKSTFLNALMGARILGTAAREYTGTVVRLSPGPARWEARLYDGRTERSSLIDPRPPLREAVTAALAERDAASVRLAETEGPLLAAERARDEARGHAQDAADALHAATDVAASATHNFDAAQQASHEHAQRALAVHAALPWFLRQPGWLAAVFVFFFSWFYKQPQRLFLDAQAAAQAAAAALPELAATQQSAQQAHADAAAILAAKQQESTDAEQRWQRAQELRRVAAGMFTSAEAALGHARQHLTQVEAEWIAAFSRDIRALTDMEARGRQVRWLDLWWPDLPADICWLDTPGVNTSDPDNQRRAWEALEEADACVVLSDLSQALSQTTVQFVQRILTTLPHIILLLSKADRARENADTTEELDEAITVGVRRFSEAIQRPPERFLALTVAAEPALRDPTGPDAAAFTASVHRLVELLHQERSLLLADRAVMVLEAGQQAIDVTLTATEAAAQERLAALNACHIPKPAVFLAEARAVLLDNLHRSAEDHRSLASLFLDQAVADQRRKLDVELRVQADRAAIGRWAAEIQSRLAQTVIAWQTALDEAEHSWAAEVTGKAAQHIQARLLAHYRVVTASAGIAGLPTVLPSLPVLLPQTASISAAIPDALKEFDRDRVGVGAGAAAAGAIVGSLILPGIGTMIGGALGAMASMLVPVERLRADCRSALDDWARQTRDALGAWLDARHRAEVDELERGIENMLFAALQSHATSIDMLIQEEEGRRAAALRRLDAILALRDELTDQRATIRRLHDAFSRQS